MEAQSIFNKNRAFYEEFLANTDQKKNSSDFLIKQIDLIKNPINILSVGAGAGAASARARKIWRGGAGRRAGFGDS